MDFDIDLDVGRGQGGDVPAPAPTPTETAVPAPAQTPDADPALAALLHDEGLHVPTAMPIEDTHLLDRLPQTAYGAIAMDLCMGILSPQQIAQQWDITTYALMTLMKTPAMRDEMTRARADIARLKQDVRGGMTLRARLMAETGLTDIYRLFKSAESSPSIKMRIFDKMTALGQLDQDRQQFAPSPQVNIVIGEGVRGITDAHTTINGD